MCIVWVSLGLKTYEELLVKNSCTKGDLLQRVQSGSLKSRFECFHYDCESNFGPCTFDRSEMTYPFSPIMNISTCSLKGVSHFYNKYLLHMVREFNSNIHNLALVGILRKLCGQDSWYIHGIKALGSMAMSCYQFFFSNPSNLDDYNKIYLMMMLQNCYIFLEFNQQLDMGWSCNYLSISVLKELYIYIYHTIHMT